MARGLALAACTLLAACGFSVSAGTGTADDDGGADDGPGTDGGSDGTNSTSCLDRWLDHSIRFDPAVAVDGVNTPSLERDPWINADETELYLSSERSDGDDPPPGGADIYRFTRSSTGTWEAQGRFLPFSSTGYDSKVSMNTAGTIAAVVSDAGGTNSDVWLATRPDSTAPWSALSKMRTMMLNSIMSDFDGFLSSDGLRIYWAPVVGTAQSISVSKRPDTDKNFMPGAVITELNSLTGDADPTVSVDQRIIVFTSQRAGADVKGAADLWYGIRATNDGPFDFVSVVPDVNTAMADGDPHLSADGCRLYFGSDLNGDWDVYVASARQP